jgi:hypothetical protein
MNKFHKSKFKPKNPHKYVGDVNNIIARSSWESDFLRYLDLNESVIQYASEEISIPYLNPLDGRVHKYYPDMLVKMIDKSGNQVVKLIEIKPYKQTKMPVVPKRKTKRYDEECVTYIINQAKWEAAEKFCQDKNWQFHKLTENELYRK